MLSGLKLINFSPCEKTAAGLEKLTRGQVFILKTCQRTLILGFNNTPNRVLNKIIENDKAEAKNLQSFEGTEAYEYLLETICGLKSRVLGENEIVHQFKEAYSIFMAKENPNRLVQNLLEKLFKDAKDIRSQHLKNIGLQTYAGITRKILSQKAKSSEELIILGSGELAEDLIKIVHRRYEITICARNHERVHQLRQQYQIKTLPFDKLEQALSQKHIVNTIGTEKRLLNPSQERAFLENTNLKSFICLAEPKPYPWEKHSCAQNVLLLEDIFDFAEHFNKEKQQKVSTASQAIKEKTLHRQNHFTLHLPFGWDELQFA